MEMLPPKWVTPDDMYRERVARAKRIPPDERLFEGLILFESAYRMTLDGIRGQNPGISDSDALAVLQGRLALQRRMEELR